MSDSFRPTACNKTARRPIIFAPIIKITESNYGKRYLHLEHDRH